MEKQESSLKRKLFKQMEWYSFILVSLLTLIVLTYIPLLSTIRYSLYDVSVIGFGQRFVGFNNYRVLVNNSAFIRSVINTLVLTLYSLLSIPIGFVLASLINSLGKGKTQSFFRIGFYFPHIITGVSVILIFQIVLKANDGILNSALSFLFRRNINIGWLSDSRYAKFGATILSIWGSLGYTMLINLANLQAIPAEIYEAAEVDGATGIQSWVHITIPQMASTFGFLLITNVIGGLARFTDLFILGGNTSVGRPGGSLQTILMYIYQFSFETPQFGIASAGAMILFVVTFIITLLNLKFTGFFRKSK